MSGCLARLCAASVALFVLFSATIIAQDAQPVCSANQLFNGQICTCAPGSGIVIVSDCAVICGGNSLASRNLGQPNRQQKEELSRTNLTETLAGIVAFGEEFNPSTLYFSSANEEVYFSFFTYGACVKGLFDRVGKEKQPACNLKCGMRVRLWAAIGVFCTFAAAVATLIFTLPMCIATCASCLHSRKASKQTKRLTAETMQQQPNKEQQMQTMSYNPYGAYWPYYGRA